MLILLLLLFQAAVAEPTHYTFQKGTLPVLLISPHGGNDPLPGATVRQKEDSADPNFSTGKDLVTAEITQLYFDELFRATGKRPSKIVSRIHRKYCDLNRKNEFSSPEKAGRDFHRAYHAAVQGELDRMVRLYGWALVLDIHGQSSEPYDLMVGTRRGRTIGPWSERTLWAQGGILDQLKRAGFSVVPDGPRQKMRFGGGYIVKTYGESDKVEAWQLEHGRDLRFDKKRNEKFAKLMADRLTRALRSH
jgi:N-formylglutamate amidohydrolase